MLLFRILCYAAAGVIFFSGSAIFGCTGPFAQEDFSSFETKVILPALAGNSQTDLFCCSPDPLDSLPHDSTASLGDDTFPADEPYSIRDLRYQTLTETVETAASSQDSLLMQIITYLGTPYVFGGNTLRGIDCSGFTLNVYRDALGVLLYRSANDQFRQGEHINSQADLQFGDLVFFNTMRRVAPGHVGIYLGDRLFVHASRSKGVIVSNLDQSYYVQRYMGARRVTDRFHGNQQ